MVNSRHSSSWMLFHRCLFLRKFISNFWFSMKTWIVKWNIPKQFSRSANAHSIPYSQFDDTKNMKLILKTCRFSAIFSIELIEYVIWNYWLEHLEVWAEISIQYLVFRCNFSSTLHSESLRHPNAITLIRTCQFTSFACITTKMFTTYELQALLIFLQNGLKILVRTWIRNLNIPKNGINNIIRIAPNAYISKAETGVHSMWM